MDGLYENYTMFAGMAASFAGFGTVALSLGKRIGGDDAKIDAHRLTNMLAASLTLVVASLLPGLLAALGIPPRWQLGLPAASVLCVMAVAGPRLARRNLAIRRLAGYNWPASVAHFLSILVAGLAFLACVIGWPDYRPAALFQLGLMGLLLASVIMFSRVAMSLLLPHNRE